MNAGVRGVISSCGCEQTAVSSGLYHPSRLAGKLQLSSQLVCDLLRGSSSSRASNQPECTVHRLEIAHDTISFVAVKYGDTVQIRLQPSQALAPRRKTKPVRRRNAAYGQFTSMAGLTGRRQVMLILPPCADHLPSAVLHASGHHVITAAIAFHSLTTADVSRFATTNYRKLHT